MMRFSSLKIGLICGVLLLSVCALVSCGKKTEFEKVEVSESRSATEAQTAAVDAVPVITEPPVSETAAETTTRRTNNRQNNTQNESPAAPEAPAGIETPDAPESPAVPETPAEPQTPGEPTTPPEPEAPPESEVPPTEPTESVSETTE